MNWYNTKYDEPPQNLIVWTKVDDEKGLRNEQKLKKVGRLWWLEDGSMYVYHTPTHWVYA